MHVAFSPLVTFFFSSVGGFQLAVIITTTKTKMRRRYLTSSQCRMPFTTDTHFQQTETDVGGREKEVMCIALAAMHGILMWGESDNLME